MKLSLKRFASLALLFVMAAPALAGESTGGCLEGFGCDNHCPLAQQANAWRATGHEALTVRSRVAQEHAAVVAKNLSRI
jgi:hypothetical protein